MFNSPKAKAIVAAVVTGAGAVIAAVQAAITDSEVTSQEAGMIVTAVIVAVAAVVGVYRTPNTPEVPEA